MSNQPINKKEENTTQQLYNRVTQREIPQISQQSTVMGQKSQNINSNQQLNQFLIPNSQNQLQLAGQIQPNTLTPQIRQINLQIKPTKPILHPIIPNQFIGGFQKNNILQVNESNKQLPFINKNNQRIHQMTDKMPIMMMNQAHSGQLMQHNQHNVYDQQWPSQKFLNNEQDFNNQMKIQMNNFGQNQCLEVQKDEDLDENFDIEQFARENGLDKEQIEQLLQTIDQKDNYDHLDLNENCDYDEQMALQYMAQQNLNQELAFTQDQLRQQFSQQEQEFYQQYDEDFIVKPEELEQLMAEGKIDPYFLEQYSQRLNCYPQTMLPYNAFQQQEQFARYGQFQQPIMCQQSEIQPYNVQENQHSNNMVALTHDNVQFRDIQQRAMAGFPPQLDYSQQLNYYQYVQQQQKPSPGIPALIEVIHPLHQLNHVDTQETNKKNFQDQLLQFEQQRNLPIQNLQNIAGECVKQLNPEGLEGVEENSYMDSERQREYERQRDEYYERELRIFYKKMREKLSKKQLDNINAQSEQICEEIDRVQKNILESKKLKQKNEESEQQILRQGSKLLQHSQSLEQDLSPKKKGLGKNNNKRQAQHQSEEKAREGANTQNITKIQPGKNQILANKDDENNSSKLQSDFLFGEECDADSTFQSQFYGPNSPIDPNAVIQCVLSELAGHQSLSKWFKRFLPEDDEEDAKSMQRKYLLLRQTMQQNLDSNQKIELLSNAGLIDPKTGQPLTIEQIQSATTPEISEKIITSLKKDSLQSLITLLQNYGEVKQTKSVVEALNKYGQDIICVVEKYQQYVSYDLQNQMLAEQKSRQKNNEQGSFDGNDSDSYLAGIKKNFVEKLGRSMETLIQLIPTEIINNQRLILKKQNLDIQKELLLGDKEDQGQFSSEEEAMTEQIGQRMRNKWLTRRQADETSMKDSEIDAKGLKKDETDSEIKSQTKQDLEEENEEEHEEQLSEQEEESVEEDWEEEKEKLAELKPGRKRVPQIVEQISKSSQEEESGLNKIDAIPQKPDSQIIQDLTLTRTKSLLTEISNLWPAEVLNLNKQEIKTFENLRKQLKLEEDWQLFIKLFTLYIYGVVGFSTFVHLFEDKFGSKIKQDLRKELELLLPTRENHRRLQSDILKPWNDPENQKFTKILDSSYYKIHDDLPLPICSGKINPENDSFYQDILNDKYLSLSKGSENFKFKVRNVHEDLIFKNEDDMYKLDNQIEMFSKCIDILQKEMEAFESMTQQQRDLYEFPRQKLRPLMFYIEKKYSTSKDLLTIKPFQSKYLAILQQGFVRKLQELENQRLDQLQHFEDVYKKNFLKSLDHRSFHYKEFIKKFTQKLHQVNEIKKTALHNQQYLRRPIWQIVGGNSHSSIYYNSFGKFLKAPEMTIEQQNEMLAQIINESGSKDLVNNEQSFEKYPHQILSFKDERALQIATKLICLHIRCSTIHHSNERIRLIAVFNDIMQNFICMQNFDVLDIQCRGSNDVAGGVLECLSSAHVDAMIASDSSKEKSYYIRRSSLSMPIQLQKTADELFDSDRKNILNNKVQQQMRESFKQQRQHTQINQQKENSMNYVKTSNEQLNRRVMFAPSNFYIFFKYLHAIYERVLHSRQLIKEKIRLDISEMSSLEKLILADIDEETLVAERYEYLLKGIFAVSIHQNSTPQTTLSDLSPSKFLYNLSPYAITNMTMLNPAGISNHGPALLDHNKFEDFCRQLVGKHAFLIFHIEKLVLQSIKQLQNMVSEPSSQRAIKLYKLNNFGELQQDHQLQLENNQQNELHSSGCKSPSLIYQNNIETQSQHLKHVSSEVSPNTLNKKTDLTHNTTQLKDQVCDPNERNYLTEYCEANVDQFSVLKYQQLIAQKLPSSKMTTKGQKKAQQTNGVNLSQGSALISSSQSNFQVFRCCYLPKHHVLTFNILDLNPFNLQLNQTGSNQLTSGQQANQLYQKAMFDNYDAINQFIMQPIDQKIAQPPLFLQKHINQEKKVTKTQLNQLEERICPVIGTLSFEPLSEDFLERKQKEVINPEMIDGIKASKLLQKRQQVQSPSLRGQNKRQKRT